MADPISIMLTGGRSAAQLYRTWAALPGFLSNLGDVDIYFGDERCVPFNHPDSNYRLALETLFAQGVPDNVCIHRMEADDQNLSAAAARYAALLPESLDVLLLSMGEDGHIASLFPASEALHENRAVVSICGPKPPYQRLTITPKVIRSARQVFVLALGEQKRSMYELAAATPEDIDAIPARLVLDRTWIFALGEFKKLNAALGYAI